MKIRKNIAVVLAVDFLEKIDFIAYGLHRDHPTAGVNKIGLKISLHVSKFYHHLFDMLKIPLSHSNH